MRQSRPVRARRLATWLAVAAAAVLGTAGLATPAQAAGTAYFVAPTGADSNSGTSAASPFRTVQKALDAAQPGTTITLAPGRYVEAVVTRVAGTAAAPIRVTGPETGRALDGRDKAVLVSPAGRAFSINHSFYTLDGFTIDGQPNIPRGDYPNVTALPQIRSFKDSVQSRAVNSKLVYVGASTTSADIVGTTISNMFLTGSGGECVRFRNRSANSTVVDTVIRWCGMLGQGNDVDQYKYHNAEGVYVGTSPKSTDQPMAANDQSNGIVVRNSAIDTFGTECFQVKENARNNRMENSDCGWNDEPSAFQGSNVELRGDNNTLLGNRVANSRGWNLKLASDAASYDRGGNSAQGNSFAGAATYAIVNRQRAPGPFCANTFAGPAVDPGGSGVGTPTAACSGATAPTVTARTPAAGATGVPVATTVTATFSGTVQGVSRTTFTLRGAGADVPAAVTYDDATKVATLDPAADLAPNTQYTATLTGGATGVRDLSGTALATTTWAFTTLAAADAAPPTVTARTPGVGATAVGRTGNITATFSEPVAGVSGTTLTLRPTRSGGTVPAAVTYDAATRVATLDPTADLAANTQYTATVTGGAGAVRDLAGNPLATATWTFTTAAAADTTAPRVSSRVPGSNATGVSRTANLTVTFSEAVQGVGATTVVVRNAGSGAVVPAAVTRDGSTNRWVVNPGSTLSSRTRFTVTVTGGVRDLAGNPLATTSWSFTTGR